MGKDVEVTTSEDITVVVHCEECDSELEITKANFSYNELEIIVKPCECQTVNSEKDETK